MKDKMIPTPPLAAVQDIAAPVPAPVEPNAQAGSVLADCLKGVQEGQITMVLCVGVGPGGSFVRNIGGSGNAYELLGLVDLQKQEMLDVLAEQVAAERSAPANT